MYRAGERGRYRGGRRVLVLAIVHLDERRLDWLG
jgi:hypothetical protein